jgi:hypothetical protein
MDLVVAIAEVVLVDESVREAEEPQIIVEALAQPNTAGVVAVRGLVARSVGRGGEIFGRSVCKRCPVACVEQLAGFQYHLDNVFVNVVLRA